MAWGVARVSARNRVAYFRSARVRRGVTHSGRALQTYRAATRLPRNVRNAAQFGWGGDGDCGATRPRRAAKSGAIESYAARHVWLHRRARAFDGRLSNGSSPMRSAPIDARDQWSEGTISSPPGDDCLLLAALAVEVCTPGYPHPATLARRAVRAEAEASRLIMVRQPCPGGTPSPTICEARQIEVDGPRQVRQAALQAALAGASTPRLARGC